MDTIEELKNKANQNKKYTVAALGILIAYNQIKQESPQLDIMLLSIASSLLEKADIEENKVDNEKFSELLNALKTGDISSYATDNMSDDLSDLLKYVQ